MLRSEAILAILLALSFLFNEAQGDEHGIVIGYATVPRRVARRMNRLHRPFVAKSDDLTQLGPGFYMVSEPGKWKGNRGSRYCVIKGPETRMQQTEKVYIPKSYQRETWYGFEKQNLWGEEDEGVIIEYMITEELIREPEKALRFSWVKGFDWQLRMLIPQNVVDEAGSDFWAECFESEAELMDNSNEIVDWNSWGIIKGHPGTPGA